jgi:hypothetical protein
LYAKVLLNGEKAKYFGLQAPGTEGRTTKDDTFLSNRRKLIPAADQEKKGFAAG